MKRVLDLLIASISLILIMPLLIVIAFVIKFTDKGPVFFKQDRVGQNGKIFTLVKFRTMIVAHDGNSISIKGENRITKPGAFLRSYKIDEIPELWNIIKGEMSFVGPRPDVPGFADKLTDENLNILKLKPGLTGPATLKYFNEDEILAKVKDPKKYNDDFIYPDKVKINLDYYYHQSIWFDLKIIWKTIFKLTS